MHTLVRITKRFHFNSIILNHTYIILNPKLKERFRKQKKFIFYFDPLSHPPQKKTYSYSLNKKWLLFGTYLVTWAFSWTSKRTSQNDSLSTLLSNIYTFYLHFCPAFDQDCSSTFQINILQSTLTRKPRMLHRRGNSPLGRPRGQSRTWKHLLNCLPSCRSSNPVGVKFASKTTAKLFN